MGRRHLDREIVFSGGENAGEAADVRVAPVAAVDASSGGDGGAVARIRRDVQAAS